jgi:SAM-dependent methyltransferase
MRFPTPGTWPTAASRCSRRATTRRAAGSPGSAGSAPAGSASTPAPATAGSRWLASQVGERGRVVAADLNVRFLEQRGNLEVLRIDLEREELPEAAFDFVHTRLLLIHLRSRDAVLEKLAAAVRPGGVLLVEEDDVYPFAANPPGDYSDAWETFMDAMSGTDSRWARSLPRRLDALGLTDVGVEPREQLFRGGSPPAQFWSLTWLEVRDRVPSAAVIDAGRAALADTSRWFHGPVTIAAWGRRPA